MRKLAVLGSTGVIGRASLEVAEHCRDRIQVTGLVAGTRTGLLAEQIRAWRCPAARAIDNRGLRAALGDVPCELLDEDGLCDFVAGPEVDVLLCAIVGTAGLRPVLAALRAGKAVALASKEILVMAGSIVRRLLREHGGRLLPVDSEHCAIFQCLDRQDPAEVGRIILTASGGPFHGHPEIDFDQVTVEQALRHPTWTMGRKITLDSASLMNKGLEMIEARWLFDLRPDQVQVVVHPQSIVHSMVEFRDGSTLAQLAVPDMRLPIQYCLDYPARRPGLTPPLDFSKAMRLTFLPPDPDRFPSLRLARQAMLAGGAAGTAFNAADEVAVQAFCRNEIRFSDIFRIVAETLDRTHDLPAATLDDIIESDACARRVAERCVGLRRTGS